MKRTGSSPAQMGGRRLLERRRSAGPWGACGRRAERRARRRRVGPWGRRGRTAREAVVAVARRTVWRSPVVEVHRMGPSRRAGFHAAAKAAAARRSRSREDGVGSLTFLRRESKGIINL